MSTRPGAHGEHHEQLVLRCGETPPAATALPLID